VASAADLVSAAFGFNIILLCIFQIAVGKVLKLMWPLYYTLQFIISMPLFKTTFP